MQLQFTIWEFVSTVGNIILPLLLIFQWYKGYAKEQAIKNALFAAHRIIERIQDPNKNSALDALDATLATLGARGPFRDGMKKCVDRALSLFKRESVKPILNLPPYSSENSEEDEIEQSRKKKQKV